jgi:hypothetical protein
VHTASHHQHCIPEGSNFNGICLAAKFYIFYIAEVCGTVFIHFKKGPFAVSDEMYLLIDRSGPVWSFFYKMILLTNLFIVKVYLVRWSY